MLVEDTAKVPFAVEPHSKSDLADSVVVLLQQAAGLFDSAVG